MRILESRERADELIGAGQRLEDEGDFAGAESHFREAVTASPTYPRAHLNLGNAFHKQGRLEESASAHRDALGLDPSYAAAHFNLGMVLLQMHALAEAGRHFERALEINPGLADAAVNLARACEEGGDLEGAKRQLERALAIAPGHAGALCNYGAVLIEAGDLVGAEKALREALRMDAHLAIALSGLARIEVLQGRPRDADSLFRAALEIEPSDAQVWSPFLFSLNLRGDLDAQAVASEHFRFGASAAPRASPRSPRASTRKPLRVGYVSGDMGKHPVGLFLRPVLAHHDRDEFQTFCYSNGHVADEVTALLRASAGEWRSIAGRGDKWVEALIRADEIDVLVDLSGHTARNRLEVFANRVAPVQATWLGYLNTTGLASMDYRICDRHTDPEGQTDALNSERLIRLPHSQWCYAPVYDVPLRGPSPSPGRPPTFGSFNQFVKISDACLDLWCEILRRVPESRLKVYGVPPGITLTDFEGRLESRGVRKSRVELYGRKSILDYFAAMEEVDVALDSMPYNGATTTLDTLWMGVPVVALRGDRAIARGSFSIASEAGLDELLAHSRSEYIEANVRLATDTGARDALRRTLRARLEASPLMDSAAFTRMLETAYRQMAAPYTREKT